MGFRMFQVAVAFMLVLTVTSVAATNDDPEIVALLQEVPHIQIPSLSAMSGNVTLGTNYGYTIDDLRGLVLDTAPHTLTHNTNYPIDQQDGWPLGSGPYVAAGIQPFRLRHFTYEFSYGAYYNSRMQDYAVTHGFNVLSPYGSQAAAPPDVQALTWGGFDWSVYFSSKGWAWGGDWMNEDTRFDYLMDGDIVSDLASWVWDYSDNNIAMLDMEYSKPLELGVLRAKPWYPSGGTTQEKQAFEDKFYAGWVKSLTAPIAAMKRKGWPSVGIYPQHYDTSYFPLWLTYDADNSYTGIPDVPSSWEWNTWGRAAVQGQDVLYPDHYVFSLTSINVAYLCARLDYALTFVNSEQVRKPIRPYLWPRLHGGSGDPAWWNQQPIPNEDGRAMTALMAFCGADGLVVWEHYGTNNAHQPPALWVDGYSTCLGVIPVPGGVGNDVMAKTNFSLWPVGANTNVGQPTLIKRYQVMVITNLNSTNQTVDFQVIDPMSGQGPGRFVDGKPLFRMDQNAFRSVIRPASETIAGMIEGLALIKPIERLLKEGEVKVDVLSIKQFHDDLAVVRRVRSSQYDLLMTYDPKVIWGGTPRNIVLTNYAGKAGLNLTLPADSQTRIYIIRHNAGSPSVITGPAASISSNSAILSGNLTTTGAQPTSVRIYWGPSDGMGTKRFWANNALLTTNANGRFSVNATGLSASSTYYYRCYASNSTAEGWAAESRQFRTRGPSGYWALDIPISESADDAEELTNGLISLTSTDLELVRDTDTNPPSPSDQHVALRFRSLDIPPGATIGAAWIQFTAKNTNQVDPCSLLIDCADTADAEILASSPYNISSRLLLGSPVAWNPPAWTNVNDAGASQRTPGLETLLQALVDKADWASGNPALFVVSGTGQRLAWSADGNYGETPPVLHVEWGGACVVPVSSSLDDVEEYHTNGVISITSSDLELIYDDALAAPRPTNQTIAIRFATVPVPAGATIDAAWIQFVSVDSNNLDPAILSIDCGNFTNAPPLATNRFGVSTLPLLGPSIDWCPTPWRRINERGIDEQTPDLAPLVQGLVNKPGWQSGNAMTFVIRGKGRRCAWSFDGSNLLAPVLNIAWGGGAAVTSITNNGLEDAEELVNGVVDLYDTVLDIAYDTHAESIPIALTEDDAEEFSNGMVDRISSDHELVYDNDNTGTVVPVASGNDDAEEYATDGTVNFTSSDLEFVHDSQVAPPRPTDQTIAIRFANLGIPSHATVQSAWIQFVAADTNNLDPSSLTIRCVDTNNAGPIGTGVFSITTLPLTATTVPWSPPSWNLLNSTGTAQRTPELASLVRDVIAKPGWQTNSAMTFVITGSGRRNAWARDGNGGQSPAVLNIVWGYEQQSAFRFSGVEVPPAANIDSAWLEFTVKDTNNMNPALLAIHAVDSSNAASISTNLFGVSSLPLLGGAVAWAPEVWSNVGAVKYSPEIKTLVQALVDKSGWQAGNAMTFVIDGTGRRNVWAKDGNGGTTPPRLKINWGESQTLGFRFQSVSIPRDAVIQSATLYFESAASNSDMANILIHAEKKVFPDQFSEAISNISGRVLSTASVTWTVPVWSSGAEEVSADVSDLVREITAMPGWESGNPMTFILSGSGTRSAWSREGNSGKTPARLVVTLCPSFMTALDSDEDGMADAWELAQLGGTNVLGGGAAEDKDGDGILNMDEYIAGTSPTNASTALIAYITRTNGGVVISYPTVAASGSAYSGQRREYRVEGSSRILGTVPWRWLDALTVEGDGQIKAYHDVGSPDGPYYRVKVRLNPPMTDY